MSGGGSIAEKLNVGTAVAQHFVVPDAEVRTELGDVNVLNHSVYKLSGLSRHYSVIHLLGIWFGSPTASLLLSLLPLRKVLCITAQCNLNPFATALR
jgi:hypothetical protein